MFTLEKMRIAGERLLSGRFLRQPIAEVGRCLDGVEAFHSIVAQPTQLRARDLPFACLRRRKPHGLRNPRNRVLLHRICGRAKLCTMSLLD